MDRTDETIPAMTPQQAELSAAGGASAFAMYRRLATGSKPLPFFAWYELLTFFAAGLPGILGLSARALLYPTILGAVKSRPAIGRGVIIRNPQNIQLGKRVLVDDYAVLDARDEGSIALGDHVSIGRFSTLAAKTGPIKLGAACNIGSYCRVATQSGIEFGESVLVGAYCYIGPGNHQAGDSDRPLIAREMEIKGGVKIASHTWIGAGVTILDGVTIGERAVIGAHSLVLSDVPAGVTVAGVPAKQIKSAA